MDNPISLYDLEQAAVIVLSEDGVSYSNQAGGTACMQPQEIGILIPISNNSSVDDLYRNTFPFKLTETCQDLVGFDSAVADVLDRVLSDVRGHDVKTDRGRLRNSMEAWVYVLFNEQKALLTWPNSD